MPFWTPNPLETTRRAQYAGSWYDSNPGHLKQQLDIYLGNAKTEPDQASGNRVQARSQPLTGGVLAIIVPHAGYMYSGQTAAYAYKAAQKGNIKRIFLLGPSHHVGFKGAALPQATSFATPIGDLEVDRELIAELKTYPLFSFHAEAHSVEHSLELQLPFIKFCFGNVKIVPIMIGHLADESEARIIGEVLKGFVGKDDLVVVSSDFTHYGPRYQYTPFANQGDIPARVGRMDGEAFQHLSRLDLEGFTKFIGNTSCTICGMYPCEVLLAMLPRQAHGTLLKYATSSDSLVEDTHNSVSYLAIAFSGAEWPDAPGVVQEAAEVVKLSEDDRQSLLSLAKSTLEIFVREKRIVSPDELNLNISDAMKECFGVFVTITKTAADGSKREHKDLRGCIGSIYPSKALYKAVHENAIAACSRDYRFQPVTAEELQYLELELSILTPPRRVDSYKDIVVGRDGVILSKRGKQAVFLPQVALEWNWSRDEMLTQLALKADLRADEWREGAKFDVFQSEKIQ